MTLTDAQVERYSRQIILPAVGGRGQARLLAARVALAGTGPVAAAAATLLARAGVGGLDVEVDMSPLPDRSGDCRIVRHADPDGAPPADVAVDLRDGAGDVRLGPAVADRPVVLGGLRDGTGPIVVTLTERPCPACVDPAVLAALGAAAPAAPLAAATALALGALAAAETLRVLLFARAESRVTVLGFLGGEVAARVPATRGACGRCRRIP
jgi:adenylyltransferase/sulfurtransferase